MKIGYDAKRYYHNNTGLGNYSRTLVNDMREMNPDIDTVLYDCKALERTFWLGHRAKKDGCDIFHGLSNELPRDIVKSSVPSVVTMHDVAWLTFPGMYSPIDRRIYDWKYGWSAQNATKVVCISESTKRDVMRFYGVPEERIEVIYQPVSENFYTPMSHFKARQICEQVLPYLEGGREFILTVGSINSRKNLLTTVKALNNIHEVRRPLLVVVGNGRSYRKTVEKYVAENDLQDFVKIESNIHNSTVLQALYTMASCMVYPSFYEGFGLPVVEAALQRCAIITSNVSSLPEAAGPGAIQIDPSSDSQLTDAIHQMVSFRTEREKNGIACQNYCREHFDPRTLTMQMRRLYESL